MMTESEHYMSIPVSEFESLHDQIKELKDILEKLADIHHRTITPSRLHDPMNIGDIRSCPARTCKVAAEILGR